MLLSEPSAAMRGWLLLAALGICLCSLPVTAAAEEGEPTGAEQSEEEPRDEDAVGASRTSDREGGLEDLQRRPLELLGRGELEDQGFVFEDPLDHQNRAVATVFALLPGTVVTGAGHWHLEDRRTARALVFTDLAGAALIVSGIVLARRPTGVEAVDERRHELFFLGAGTLGTTWLIDVFGTAYRDDLGVPESTERYTGWGAGIKYHYWRPRGLSMRHVADAEVAMRTRRFHVKGRTGQELGMGMSDYELSGRWDPFVGSSRDTRVGVELGGRYLQYRLDEPYQRADVGTRLHLSLNLGRLFTHLDQLVVGIYAGVALRGYRFLDGDGGYTSLRYGGWTIPLRMYLALNLTEQLRLETGFQRGEGGWLQSTPRLIGTPTVDLTYRSTETVDLHFFGRFGQGFAFGAGMRLWFGE